MDNYSNKPRRTAIYIRVSTQEQKVDGYGLEAQRTKLREYIKNNTALNLKEVDIFEDTHTGSDLNRKSFLKMMEGVKAKKFDAVLVWKIDRLSRSLKHLLHTFEVMKDSGVSFISVQENIDFRGAIGGLIFQIFGAIAQFERELIKGRTNMGKIMSAEMGNYTGSTIPYGYKPILNASGKGKKLEIITEERKWIEKIFQWYIYEGLGDMAIAKRLNELKVPPGQYSPRRRTKWSARHIEHIIPNEIYQGQFVANKTDEEGHMLPVEKWTVVNIPECISEFVYIQAQQIRKNRNNGVGEKSAKYLLSGKLKDMSLDKPLAFAGRVRSDGKKCYYRKANAEKGLSVFELPADGIEEYVWSKILKAMKDPKSFIKEWVKREHIDETQIDSFKKDLTRLKEEAVNIELNMARIESFGENGTYSEEKMAQKLQKHNEELERVQSKINEIEKKIEFLGGVKLEIEKLKDASKQFKHLMDKPSRVQRKIIIQLFVDRVEVYKKKLSPEQQTEKRTKYEKRIRVVYRFNPKKFLEELAEDGTTLTSTTNTKKDPLGSSNSISGNTNISTYFMICFRLRR